MIVVSFPAEKSQLLVNVLCFLGHRFYYAGNIPITQCEKIQNAVCGNQNIVSFSLQGTPEFRDLFWEVFIREFPDVTVPDRKYRNTRP